MRVAVVGAGMAGLGAARTLREAGAGVVVFEKSRGPGGRCATRRREGFVWDTGATSLALRGGPLDDALPPGWVEVGREIGVHRGLSPGPGDPRHAAVRRVVWPEGMSALARGLAEGLEVRTGVEVEGIGRRGTGFEVAGERFDALVLTPPIPQTARLLWTLGVSAPVAAARYRPCLSVSLGFDAPTPEGRWWAFLDDSRAHDVVWASCESAKCPGRAPGDGSAFGVQFSPRFSRENWSLDEPTLAKIATSAIARLFGEAYAAPVAVDVMRWKYAQPDALSVPFPPVAGIAVTGDGIGGGKLELAYADGVRAARELLQGR